MLQQTRTVFLLAVMVTAAHVHDSKAALLLARVLKGLLCGIRTIACDWGLPWGNHRAGKKRFGYILQIVMRSDDRV